MPATSSPRRLGGFPLALVAAVSTTLCSGATLAPGHAAPQRTVVVTGLGDAASAVRSAGGTVLRHLPLVHGVVARLSATSLPGFVVTPDRALSVAGRRDTGTGTAVNARTALGLGEAHGEGAGVTVAVVDTGVADVPELAGRVRHLDVTGDGVGDGYGHGTFVAGLVAGSVHGVAPGASVLDVRVAHDDGSTSLSEVLTGLQLVSEDPSVRVVNLSLSTDEPVPPLLDGLEALWAEGDTVVVPAGNEGPDVGTVTSPGSDPTLLTVGALDGSEVAEWSSRGGRGLAKPDLVAPGAHLLSAGVPGSVVWAAHPDARRGDDTLVGSGTSFSTALVSGAAAVALAGRDLSPGQVKALVMRSADPVPGPRRATGDGSLDLAAALDARTPQELPTQSGDGSGSGDLGGVPWDASSWAARQWAARQWAARQWAGAEWSGDWAARQWAARQWAARQWSASSWE